GAAQRLLRGEKAGPDRLAGLLAAAAGPVESGELVGEEAVVSVFREAHLVPALPLRRQSVIKTVWAKLLTLKVAAAALTAAGGAPPPAGTGPLPGPADGGATPADGRRPGHTSVPHHTAKPSPTPDKPPGAGPSPSLAGLCNAYHAGAGHNSD